MLFLGVIRKKYYIWSIRNFEEIKEGYTKDQILRASKSAGLDVRSASEGCKSAFVSYDMSICDKMNSEKFSTDFDVPINSKSKFGKFI